MIRLKDPRTLIYSAWKVCEVEGCEEESTKIWASNESRIIDICSHHYEDIVNLGYLS